MSELKLLVTGGLKTENKKAARVWAAPLQSGSNFSSEFAMGYAASGLRVKVTRKTKIIIGGKTIHLILNWLLHSVCQCRGLFSPNSIPTTHPERLAIPLL